MAKQLRFVLCFVVIVLFFSTSSLFADKYSRSAVQKEIQKVEKKLEKYSHLEKRGMGREIYKIEAYIKNAKKLLVENDRDEAWYEIGKANAYFKLIEAKKYLFAAEKKYKAATRGK
ncbi:MAG: hypothetical protein GY754_14215 [bacterium]|nr:hypothetical protein [bacterium]